MLSSIASLALIMFVAALAPYVASLIPGRPVPEVVFLVVAGTVLGPHVLGLVNASSPAISLVSNLGLGFLFMLAGYEIEPQTLKSRSTVHATIAWAVSLVLGIVFTNTVLAGRLTGIGGMAFAIALTTTAYGTLAPILRDRGIIGTPAGDAVTVYGALGELLPILAMSFLLSTRRKMASLGVLVMFVLACLAILVLPSLFPRFTRSFEGFLRKNAWTGSKPMLRVAVLLLLVLLALSETLGLDMVLGAFAAGFLLRALAPGNGELICEELGNIGNGFLIPCFFVISGTKIDPSVAGANFGLVMGFVGLLALIRGGVVGISLNVNPDTRHALSGAEKYSVAAYCTMALPLIVAVTDVAVEEGAMSLTLASILVTAGALTVLLIPIATSFVRVAQGAHPVQAVREVTQDHKSVQEVFEQHQQSLHASEESFRDARARHRQEGKQLSSTDYLVKHEHDNSHDDSQ